MGVVGALQLPMNFTSKHLKMIAFPLGFFEYDEMCEAFKKPGGSLATYEAWASNSWVKPLLASIAATRDFKLLARSGFIVDFGTAAVASMTTASPEVGLQDCPFGFNALAAGNFESIRAHIILHVIDKLVRFPPRSRFRLVRGEAGRAMEILAQASEAIG